MCTDIYIYMYKSVHIDHWAYAVQAKVPSAGHYDQELPGTQSSPRGASSTSNTWLYPLSTLNTFYNSYYKSLLATVAGRKRAAAYITHRLAALTFTFGRFLGLVKWPAQGSNAFVKWEKFQCITAQFAWNEYQWNCIYNYQIIRWVKYLKNEPF